ncbi:hypothetical protein [Ornithinibacillus gellani]|uniref:hypothetical protein n=1 Tax=Ornithinibacillus gellani TaxID=2293253 RepID=UPI0016800D79|nr:hypothetical protein [Ornithinibacillus gellani]
MEQIAFWIVMTILFIPLYGIFIWSYVAPEQSILFGKRWMFKHDPEPSETAIRYTKFMSLIAMISFPLFIIGSFIHKGIFPFLLLLFLIVLVVGIVQVVSGGDD